MLLGLILCLSCRAKDGKDLSDVTAAEVTSVTIQGSSVAGKNPFDNAIQIDDRSTIESFLNAFQRRVEPTEYTSDKVNSVVFKLKNGREVKFPFGKTTILTQLGPEVATVLKPYLKKD